MLFTALFIVALIALLGVSLVLWGLLLRLGLRWAKTPVVTTGRLALAAIMVATLEMLLNVLAGFASNIESIPIVPLAILTIAPFVLIPLVVIAWIFKLPFPKTLLAWLPTLAAPVILIRFAVFVIKPYLYEAFVIPSNSMAPTLVGQHWKSTCTECGQPAFCSPLPPDQNRGEPPLRICESNFHITQPIESGGQEFSGDRLIAAKFLWPQRWDLVIFQLPSAPEVIYVKRLVGLPGEKVTIRNGQVWADGKPLTPPESIRGIKYTSDVESGWNVRQIWGAPDIPAQLADDEYFFLGDFSPRAQDSRFWEEGAPDHNPYAVPRSYIRGVVTTIYWPPSRWRAFQ